MIFHAVESVPRPENRGPNYFFLMWLIKSTLLLANWKHSARLNHINYQLANDICVAEERSGELVEETVLLSICCICKIVGYVSFVSCQLTVNCTDLSWCVSFDQICSSYQSYLFFLCHLSGKLNLLYRLLLQLTSYLLKCINFLSSWKPNRYFNGQNSYHECQHHWWKLHELQMN